MDVKHKTHDLSHGECARCDDVQTNEKKQDKAHSHSGVWVVNLKIHENGHVVIDVRIVQCYHVIRANSEFPLLVPIINLLSDCMIWIVPFSCGQLVHTFAPRKHVI